MLTWLWFTCVESPYRTLSCPQENASIWVFLSHQKTFICSDRELDIKYRESLFQKSQPVENLATWVKFRVGNWQQNPRPEGCCGNWGFPGLFKNIQMENGEIPWKGENLQIGGCRPPPPMEDFCWSGWMMVPSTARNPSMFASLVN